MTIETMRLCNQKREELKSFVARHKIGKHGLVPLGSRGLAHRASRNQGKRRQDPEKAKERTLYEVLSRMGKRVAKEREFNHEIRYSHATERFKHEAEYERYRQIVFEHTGSPKFKPASLTGLREILATKACNSSLFWFHSLIVSIVTGGSFYMYPKLAARMLH